MTGPIWSNCLRNTNKVSVPGAGVVMAGERGKTDSNDPPVSPLIPALALVPPRHHNKYPLITAPLR